MEINERGNTIERAFDNIDRYHYDFVECKKKDGWLQYDTDQDAHYFGIWVHPEKRVIVSYIEGDITVVKCKNAESIREEIKVMNDFYGSPPPAFTVFDLKEKTITKYVDHEARNLSK